MKINLTKKEYRALLDLVSIAEWVMNSHRTDKDPRSPEHDQIEQKILSHARDFGFENLVTYNKKYDRYDHTREYEDSENFFPFIEEFEEDSFWDKLCTYLAKRDLLLKLGVEKITAMDPFDRISMEDEIAVRYSEEFEKNGLKNLVLPNLSA